MRISPVVQSLTRPLLSPLVSGLRDELFGAFTPRSLFNDGSIGVLYDNNDFVDSATWRRNLLTYSEQFDNAIHAKINATISANSAVAPDGTTTADTLLDNATAGGHSKQAAQALSSVGTNYVYSIYAKAATASRVMVYGLNAVGGRGVGVDLTNGSTFTVSGITLETGAVVTDVGNGWYRISIPVTPVSTATQALGGVYTVSGTSFSYSGTGTGVYIWGEQLEAGSTTTAYQRITDFNSDFLAAFPNTTLFADAAGTTPATVNGLVGLQLDKSQGLALGAELAPATTSVSGWTPNANCTIASVGGELELTATAVGVCVADFNVAGTSSGKNYLLTAVCRQGQAAGSGASVAIAFGTVPYSIANTTTTNASVRVVKVATVGAEILRIRFDSTAIGQKAYFSLLSFKELPGNHRYQSTTGSKPILRGTPTGANTVSNPNFDSDVSWGKGAGWAIGSGVATATAATGFLAAAMTTPVVAGNFYRVTYTITRTAGSISPNIGGRTGTSRSASGTYVDYIQALNAGAFVFVPSTFSGTVDNVEVMDVSAGSVTAPYGLQYDGVDDFLQTASVNFSATDKMFVCAGVRKLSDAAVGLLVELSASAVTNNGSFAVLAPSTSSGNNFLFASKGSAAVVSQGSLLVYPSPSTQVITGIADISGDITRIRTSGAERTNTADQGTGNYGNYQIYFGRRNGTSDPFNGLDFGFCIVGKTLTASQIANTERWMAYRTGVTL